MINYLHFTLRKILPKEGVRFITEDQRVPFYTSMSIPKASRFSSLSVFSGTRALKSLTNLSEMS